MIAFYWNNVIKSCDLDLANAILYQSVYLLEYQSLLVDKKSIAFADYTLHYNIIYILNWCLSSVELKCSMLWFRAKIKYK